jgi:hypothetical protein
MKTQTMQIKQTMQTESTTMKAALVKTKRTSSIQLRNAVFGGSLKKAPLALLAALGLMAWGPVNANAANVLFNPNLDQTGFTTQLNPCPIGWTVIATKTISGDFFDGGDSETFCNVTPPSDPAGYGFFFKPFQGSLGPPADVLTVELYQDNPATPGTKFTLSGYAACEANYSGLITTNDPPSATLFVVEFLNSSGDVIQSNAFNLIANGMPQTGPASMALLTTPQYTAPANTATVRVGAWMENVYNNPAGGGQSFFVDSFDLESVAAPGSPVITSQPSQTAVAPGGTVNLTVGATGATSYQWQLYNTNLSNVPSHISGATTPTLTITGASASDVGHYRVLVSNASGSVFSADAPLALDTLNFFPVVSLTGKIGDTYRVDYSTSIAPTTWIPLSTNKLTTSPQMIIDTTSPMNNTRFYREVFLY